MKDETRKAVLFDMDGVLALTESIKAEAHSKTIEKLGSKAPPNIYLRMIGQSHDSIRAAFLKAAGIDATADINSDYSKIFREIYNNLIDEKLTIRPGAKKLVEELKKQGFLLGIVSSSSLSSIKKILIAGEMESIFDVCVSAEDVKEKKPHPEPYVHAINALGLDKNDVLAFEDSSVGVQSAISAGIHAVGVRHDFNKDDEFEKSFTVLESFLDTKSIVNMIKDILLERD